MTTATAPPLTEIQKISIILSTLPDDQCVDVLKNYSEEAVERICAAMVSPVPVLSLIHIFPTLQRPMARHETYCFGVVCLAHILQLGLSLIHI